MCAREVACLPSGDGSGNSVVIDVLCVHDTVPCAAGVCVRDPMCLCGLYCTGVPRLPAFNGPIDHRAPAAGLQGSCSCRFATCCIGTAGPQLCNITCCPAATVLVQMAPSSHTGSRTLLNRPDKEASSRHAHAHMNDH